MILCYTRAMAAGNIPRLVEVLKVRSGDEKRLPCGEAFKVARDLEVPVAEVGKACNELGIKIVHCQLGCFWPPPTPARPTRPLPTSARPLARPLRSRFVLPPIRRLRLPSVQLRVSTGIVRLTAPRRRVRSP